MVEHCCSDMQYMIEEEQSIIFLPEFREYGVPILDGGGSFLQMSFCPWCGKKLPENMRSEKWWQEKMADNSAENKQF